MIFFFFFRYLYDFQSSNISIFPFQFDILASLHPSPAVCGFPTEEARLFIAEAGRCYSTVVFFCFFAALY